MFVKLGEFLVFLRHPPPQIVSKKKQLFRGKNSPSPNPTFLRQLSSYRKSVPPFHGHPTGSIPKILLPFCWRRLAREVRTCIWNVQMQQFVYIGSTKQHVQVCKCMDLQKNTYAEYLHMYISNYLKTHVYIHTFVGKYSNFTRKCCFNVHHSWGPIHQQTTCSPVQIYGPRCHKRRLDHQSRKCTKNRND